MNAGTRIELLKAELLRWNEQINLVSRVDATRRVDDLVVQCRRGWTSVVAMLGAESWFDGAVLVDIGSGGGLPGLVWAAERESEGIDAGSLLVEPREKRAWFLRRTARVMGLAAVEVATCRWGGRRLASVAAGGDGAVVSLKAVKMSDGDVLRGMAAVPGLFGAKVAAIVRFLPPDPGEVEDLVREHAAGDREPAAAWTRIEGAVVGESAGRLLVIRYERRG